MDRRLYSSPGLLNFTVLGGRHMQETNAYLANHHLKVDDRGADHKSI